MRIGIVICTIGRESLAKTLACIREQPYDQLHIVRDEEGNLSKARNIGWKALADTCDVIAFTDDDCLPDKDWVAKGRVLFEQNPRCSFMQGKVYGGIKTSATFCFVGANYWARVSALKELGGFDEEYLYAGGSEDLDFCWRLLDKGRECLGNDLCKVKHPSKAQHVELPENSRRLAKKFPERYSALIFRNTAII